MHRVKKSLFALVLTVFALPTFADEPPKMSL